MEPAANRMSQAAYGRARDLSRQRVGQLVKDGRVPLDQDGLVIVDQADSNLATMLDQRKANRERQVAAVEAPAGRTGALALDEEPARREPAKSDDKPRAEANEASSYWKEKARRERIEADRADLALRKQIGELVLASDVESSRFNTAQKVANAMLQIPARIAPVVAPNDPQRAELLMTEEIKKVIHELAGDLDQPVAGDDAERPEARAA
jgi:hypothetical protein